MEARHRCDASQPHRACSSPECETGRVRGGETGRETQSALFGRAALCRTISLFLGLPLIFPPSSPFFLFLTHTQFHIPAHTCHASPSRKTRSLYSFTLPLTTFPFFLGTLPSSLPSRRPVSLSITFIPAFVVSCCL